MTVELCMASSTSSKHPQNENTKISEQTRSQDFQKGGYMGVSSVCMRAQVCISPFTLGIRTVPELFWCLV